MNIPEKYSWLSTVGTLPKTIDEGLRLLGVKEVVGRGSNKTIIDWRDILNAASPVGNPIIKGYSDDDIPWCGLLAAVIAFFRANNISEVVDAPLWAANWSLYGREVATRVNGILKSSTGLKPSLGDILVFKRPKGNHVAFYVAEDDTSYHVLGGNQSNAVTITRILKSRCWSVRRPPYKVVPTSVKPYYVKAAGVISTNEA